MRAIFEDILGYEDAPQKKESTLKSQASTDVDTSRPDVILGFYKRDNGEKKDHRAVIELKGPQVPLDKDQKRKGTTYKSPVDQGFSYTNKLDKCRWVIISNFTEIRLYQVGRSKEYYELFYLNELDDINKFKKFHYLLSKNNLISRDGKSQTLQLTEATQKRHEDISVKFYNLYKNVRINLFEHLKEFNQDIDFEILLEKAQKFLDRIVFICFCEDKGLLPNNLLHNAIKQAKKSFAVTGTAVWSEIKGVFKAIDKGMPNKDINAYNGGLFEYDKALDNLAIKDNFFDAIYDISNYDFDSDVDVNILGHIFEQSISDIEKLKSDIKDNEYNKKESRRKKEGIYYTPQYITSYIVENAVGGYLEDIKKRLGYYNLPNIEEAGSSSWQTRYTKNHIKFYNEYEEKLKDVKILDPACGSGAFLNQAFDYLLQEHQWLNKQRDLLKGGQSSIFAVEALQRTILKNNLYGVDLNEESVEITKLSLWLKTANKNKPLTNLDSNIKCGNSLIGNPQIIRNKAFDWQEQFEDIIKKRGFNVVIGNPPWVSFGLRGVDKLDSEEDNYYRKNYESAEYKLSTYALFVEKGIDLLKENGRISYITPDSFLLGRYFSNLRKYILNNCNIEELLMTTFDVFAKHASTGRNVISNFVKKDSNNKKIKVSLSQDPNDFNNNNFKSYKYSQEYFNKLIYNRFRLIFDEKVYSIINKIDKGDKLERHFGLYSGCIARYGQKSLISDHKKDYLTIKNNGKIIFVDQDARNKWEPLIISGSEFSKYSSIEPNNFIYIDKDSKVLKKITKSGFDFPKYENPKLFVRQTGDHIVATYDGSRLFCLNNTHSVYPKEDKMNLKYLLAILNSNLLEFYYKKTTLEEGRTMAQTDIETIEKLPIRFKNKKIEDKIVPLVDNMLELKVQLSHKRKNDFLKLTSLYTSSNKKRVKSIVNNSSFNNFIYSGRARKVRDFTVNINTNIITIYADKSGSGKYELLKFEENDEHKRQYLKLSLENLAEEQLEKIDSYSGNILKKTLQIEIPDYDKYQVVKKVVKEWESLQREIENLEDKIEKTDSEIDQMVYDLYDLTDEEIKIVEESL